MQDAKTKIAKYKQNKAKSSSHTQRATSKSKALQIKAQKDFKFKAFALNLWILRCAQYDKKMVQYNNESEYSITLSMTRLLFIAKG